MDSHAVTPSTERVVINGAFTAQRVRHYRGQYQLRTAADSDLCNKRVHEHFYMEKGVTLLRLMETSIRPWRRSQDSTA